VKLWENEHDTDVQEPGDQSTRWILWSRDGRSHLVPKGRPDTPAVPRWKQGIPASQPDRPGDALSDADHTPRMATLARSAGGQYRDPRHRAALAHPEPGPPVWDESAIHRLIDERHVGVVFQPVVDVRRGEVVAFEALARGPEGPLHRPQKLFAAARSVGRGGELDWAIRAHAFRTMMDAGLHPSVSLFVNIAPDSLIDPCPEDLLPTIWEAETRLRVFVDIDGGSALRHPRAVLESVRRARAAGWGVSLDDVGYSAGSMAFLPVLEPDVIRLDHGLLSAGIALGEATLTAALGEAERNGAALIVGNIPDAGGTAEASSVGAAYQQGWAHGREGTLPGALPDPVAAIPMLSVPPATGLTPWELVEEAGARTMLGLHGSAAGNTARQLLGEISRLPQTPVLALLLPHRYQSAADAGAMRRVLIENAPLTLVMGEDVSHHDDWRTRAIQIPAGHLLADQGCIVAMSGALKMVVAFRRSAGARGDESWDLAITQNRATTRRVMRELLHHADRLSGGVVASLEGTG
jgi:EAL domain-containing protein (putative c-di-GMP-specific phosphodiesterase class I)